MYQRATACEREKERERETPSTVLETAHAPSCTEKCTNNTRLNLRVSTILHPAQVWGKDTHTHTHTHTLTADINKIDLYIYRSCSDPNNPNNPNVSRYQGIKVELGWRPEDVSKSYCVRKREKESTRLNEIYLAPVRTLKTLGKNPNSPLV
jgi:hypothetical protein